LTAGNRILHELSLTGPEKWRWAIPCTPKSGTMGSAVCEWDLAQWWDDRTDRIQSGIIKQRCHIPTLQPQCYQITLHTHRHAYAIKHPWICIKFATINTVCSWQRKMYVASQTHRILISPHHRISLYHSHSLSLVEQTHRNTHSINVA